MPSNSARVPSKIPIAEFISLYARCYLVYQRTRDQKDYALLSLAHRLGQQRVKAARHKKNLDRWLTGIDEVHKQPTRALAWAHQFNRDNSQMAIEWPEFISAGLIP